MNIIKQILKRNLLNIPGWKTRRHIVVIESDDWGSIRMPSWSVYNEFLKRGIHVERDPYCRFDSMATEADLTALFETLLSVKDSKGRPAVLTANAVVANPCFSRIKESGYLDYFYEPFTDTLKNSNDHRGVFDVWKQGLAEGIFHPQFHGREHLNVKKWLKALQSGDEVTRISFELGTFGLTSLVDQRIKHNYMGAFNSGLDEDVREYDEILTDGLSLFEKLFGYRSQSFIATTYTWSPKIEYNLKKQGVDYLQGMVHQHIPLDDDTTFSWKKNNFLGKKSPGGQLYLTRNCYFEPSQNSEGARECLKRIQIAFRWHKPAIISMHRLNVIGSIDERNRTQNLSDFKWLLKQVVKDYPDVEFMSSDELGRIISMS